MLTEEPQRRFSVCEPFAAEGSSLKTSIVMELCDRGSLLNNREKIWTVMKQVPIWPILVPKQAMMHVICYPGASQQQ